MNNVKAIIDTLGRTILGVEDEEKSCEKFIALQNPVILVPKPEGKNSMGINLMPIFFQEFQADREQPVSWKYSRDMNPTPTEDFLLDPRITGAYNNMINGVAPSAPPTQQPLPIQQPTGNTGANVALFDDDDE